MGIDDIKTLVRVANKADEVATAAKAGQKLHTIVEYNGVRYGFPKGTKKEDALRFLWESGIGPGRKGEVVELPSELPGPKWDAENGMGNVELISPGYFKSRQGFVRNMTPDEFLSHAPGYYEQIRRDARYGRLEQGVEDGKAMAPPYLVVRWDPKRNVWRMQSHEGRHRSVLVAEKYGQVDMPVHIVPRKEDGTVWAEGEITDEMRKAPIVGVAAAAVVPADEKKPKKLDPGIYLDEDTGKYFKIDKDGSMTELEANEAP